MPWLGFSCPLCGFHGQRFPFLSALKRQAKVPCCGCGVVLRSDPRLGTYTLYVMCTQVFALLLALPLVWAVSARAWGWLGLIVLMGLVPCWMLGAIRHARSPIVRATRDPNRSYARREPMRDAEAPSQDQNGP